ncbi:hypothetical protein NMG60_11030435 [Bertholletia excelsa]
MFKSARWKSERNKIKAVFKLQFHATRVLEVGGDSLTISLVPADVGKPTARLEKGEIREGICYWKNPVYETVKLFREPKTGKIHEKIYYFVISTGSSKAGLVGEVSIDLASYAELLKPSTVSLPLRNSKSQAILHVSVQRMRENGDQREAEEIEDSKNNVEDRSLKAHLSSRDADESIQTNSTEDEPFNSGRLLHTVGSDRDHQASSGSDRTISSSECSSELNTPREFGSKGNMVQPDPSSLLSSVTNNSGLQRTTSEMSTDDSLSSSRDAFRGEKSEESSSIVIEKLKSELSALSRQAEVSELELQTLRKQIVKESKRGQELFREVIGLKGERDLLKEECERFKAFQKRMDEPKTRNKLQFEGGDPLVLMEELRQELNYEKDLNANLRIQLQKTQESNDELILAVQDLEEMLEKKNGKILNLPKEELREMNSKSDMEDDEEQKALEKLVKEHSDLQEAHVLEQKVTDLCNELEICRRDKDELEVQLEQLALDYEILKQENHDISYKLEQSQIQEQLKMQYECSSSYAVIHDLETQIANLESELKKQSNELVDSSLTITRLETSLMSLEEELEKQAQGFKAEFEILTQKAMIAEEALRTEHEAQIESLESELKKQSNEVEDSLATITKLQTNIKSLEEELVITHAKVEKEEKAIKTGEALRDNLEKQIENLESKLKEQSNEFSNSLATITRLETHVKSLEEELEKQAQGFEADLQILTRNKDEKEEAIRAENTLRKDLETQMEKLESELEKKSNEFSDTLDTILRLETRVKSLEEELEKQAQGFEADLQIVSCAKAEKEQEALKAEESLRKDLETHIEKLESELEHKSNEFSDSLATINKLEIHIKSLEEELERQEQLFEADVEVLTRAKVEQEQKAIRAEEGLRKMRWQNANTAERLQVEFRRLSVEMASTFEANEKLAAKALTETHELRLQKNHLQELLQKANEEVQLVRGQYKEKLHEVSCEITLKVKQIEQMQSEIDDMSKQLKRLQNENNELSIEVERMESSKKETEMLLQRANLDRTEMESMIALLREESIKSIQELNSLRTLKDEKETIIRNLQLELESQQSQYDELKDALIEDEVEKENLRKNVLKLIGDLSNKDDAIDCLEKKLKDKMELLEDQIKTRETAIENSINSFLEKEKDLQCKIEDLERRLEELSGNNTSFCEHKFEKVVKDPQEMISTAENLCIMKIGRDIEIPSEKEMETSALNARDQGKLEELLNEMEVLKEKTKQWKMT